MRIECKSRSGCNADTSPSRQRQLCAAGSSGQLTRANPPAIPGDEGQWLALTPIRSHRGPDKSPITLVSSEMLGIVSWIRPPVLQCIFEEEFYFCLFHFLDV